MSVSMLSQPRFYQNHSSKFFHAEILITLVRRLGTIDPTTKKYGSIPYSNSIDPKARLSGWVSFEFHLIKQDKDDPIKLIPNGASSGQFVGESNVLPTYAPYVVFQVVMTQDQKKEKQVTIDTVWKKSAKHALKKSSTDIIYYTIREVISHTFVPGDSLTNRMLNFILQQELQVNNKAVLLDVVQFCEKTSRHSQVKKYDILKLRDHSNFKHIFQKYERESFHALGKTSLEAAAWCPLIKTNTLQDSVGKELLIEFKNECLKDPIETFFFGSIVVNPRVRAIGVLEDQLKQEVKSTSPTWENLFANAKYHHLFNQPKEAYSNLCVNINQKCFLDWLLRNPSFKETGERIQNMVHALTTIRKYMMRGSRRDSIFYEAPSVEAEDQMALLEKYHLIYKHSRSVPGFRGETIQLSYYKLHKQEWILRGIMAGLKLIHTNHTENKRQISEGKVLSTTIDVVDNSPSSNLQNDVKTVDLPNPLVGRDLDEKQGAFIANALSKKFPVMCLTGPPGTGKTHIIRMLFRLFNQCKQEEARFVSTDPSIPYLPMGNIMAVSYVNTAASQLQQYGIPAYGICALSADKNFKLVSESFLAETRILVVEEFSNFSEEAFSLVMQFVATRCKKVDLMILVYDPDQINPIDPGNPSKCMEKIYPQATTRLAMDFRVNIDPECQVLVENARQYKVNHVLVGDFTFKEILLSPSTNTVASFPTFLAPSTPIIMPFINSTPWLSKTTTTVTATSTTPSTITLPEKGAIHILDVDAPTICAKWLIENEEPGKILQGTQFLCFQNVLIDSLNDFLDHKIHLLLSGHRKTKFPFFADLDVTQTSLYKSCTEPPRLKTFYLGQKILFTENIVERHEFKGASITFANGKTIHGCTFRTAGVLNGGLARIKGVYKYYKHTKTLVHVQSGENTSTNTSQNEDFALVLNCISPTDDSWEEIVAKHYTPSPFPLILGKLNTTNVQGNLQSGLKKLFASDDGDVVHTNQEKSITPCTAADSKFQSFVDSVFNNSFLVLVKKTGGITLSVIGPAWALSVDKYQGRQAETVVLNLLPNDGSYFTKEHGYVGISRARKRFILCGPLEQLQKMSRKEPQERDTDFVERIKKVLMLDK